jgi:putative transposase
MKPDHLEVTPQPHTFFITSNTGQGFAVFQVEQWARVFLKNLYHYRRSGDYLLHEFVLMPNHFHLLLTPAAETTLEKAMQLVKGGSAYKLKGAGRVKGNVWQRGFTDRRVRDVDEYQGFREYIFQNPVKAGLAQRPEDYRYSSAYPGWKLDPPRPYLSG